MTIIRKVRGPVRSFERSETDAGSPTASRSSGDASTQPRGVRTVPYGTAGDAPVSSGAGVTTQRSVRGRENTDRL